VPQPPTFDLLTLKVVVPVTYDVGYLCATGFWVIIGSCYRDWWFTAPVG